MKHFIYILIGLFVLCSTANDGYGQFWKKKGATSSKKRDAFAGKSKKGPNVQSSKHPRTKSRSKLYSHSVSKKSLKGKKRPVFSSSKRRYKSVNSKAKGKNKGTSAPGSGGRKSGKGRKKKDK